SGAWRQAPTPTRAPWGRGGTGARMMYHAEPFHPSLNARPRIVLPVARQWNPLKQDPPARMAHVCPEGVTAQAEPFQRSASVAEPSPTDMQSRLTQEVLSSS